MNDIPLHDIKPLVEVPNDSFIYLSVIAVVFVIIVFLLLVWLWRFYRRKKGVDVRKLYLKKIHNIDFNDSKKAAYDISHYGRMLAESEREIEILENLDRRLSGYKYKKDVGQIDDETLNYYRLFLGVLDAS